jgi:hypothetical protein
MAQVRLSQGRWALIGGFLIVGAFIPVYFFYGQHDHVFSDTFVGPHVCQKCHEEQAESWHQTRMAMTFEVLRPGVMVKQKEMVGLDPDFDYTHDEDCLPCHTTGYGLVGGFVSIEKTPEMAGVTCEACHGPGGSYADGPMKASDPSFTTSEARDAGLIYPPSAAVCRSCHNDESPFIGMGYEFDYSERVEQGTHAHFELKYDHGKDK